MSDARADDTLLHQLDRQRADLLEAVRVYEEELAQHAQRVRELEEERDSERTRSAEVQFENRKLRAMAERLHSAIEELPAAREQR